MLDPEKNSAAGELASNSQLIVASQNWGGGLGRGLGWTGRRTGVDWRGLEGDGRWIILAHEQILSLCLEPLGRSSQTVDQSYWVGWSGKRKIAHLHQILLLHRASEGHVGGQTQRGQQQDDAGQDEGSWMDPCWRTEGRNPWGNTSSFLPASFRQLANIHEWPRILSVPRTMIAEGSFQGQEKDTLKMLYLAMALRLIYGFTVLYSPL